MIAFLEEIKKIIIEKDLINQSRIIAQKELLQLNKKEIEELLNADYEEENIIELSNNMKIITYGIEHYISFDIERIKLSFDFVDYENEQTAIFYCFYDTDGNYIDSFFD